MCSKQIKLMGPKPKGWNAYPEKYQKSVETDIGMVAAKKS